MPTRTLTLTLFKRKPGLYLVLSVLLAGAGVAAYFMWRPRAPVVPALSTDGLDPEVAAAIDKARSAVEESPESAATWGRLGMVLFAHNRLADAAVILAEAERLDGDDVRWPYLRGLALMLQHPDQGIVALERAATIRPVTPGVRLRLAEEFLKLDRMDEADVLFRQLLAEYGGNPRALLGRGQVLSRRGQWREALAPLQIAAANPTARRSACVALAEAYLRLRDPSAAEVERKKLADTADDQPWPDAIVAEAQAFRTGLQPRIDQTLDLLRERRIDDAGDLIAQVLRDHPNSAEAHVTLAKVLIRAPALAEAEGTLHHAIALNSDLVDAHFLLAGTYMLQKNYPAAERSYLRTIELKPSHGLAHFNLAECRKKQGNRAGAIVAFRNAVRYRPDLAAAHLELGALLLEDGKVKQAVEHLDNAVRLDGKNERARTLLEQARGKKEP